MNEREREKVWQCHVCSSQQLACMLADCRDGGGGLVAVLSAQKATTPLPMGAGQGRHFHCQSAGQKLFLPAVRQGAM